MKVILSGDHAGFALRQDIRDVLEEMAVSYEDVGADDAASVDYPDYAFTPAERVANGEFDRGILICGTGIGVSISANKVRGVRCAVVHDVFSAKATRQHNDANILAMGERVIGPGLAKEIVETWLATEFSGGRHNRRVEKITAYEQKQQERSRD